jgi:hypothetical protein
MRARRVVVSETQCEVIKCVVSRVVRSRACVEEESARSGDVVKRVVKKVFVAGLVVVLR